ncbi:MAG: EAL domain-containing protein [Sphingomicrobium sp.]
MDQTLPTTTDPAADRRRARRPEEWLDLRQLLRLQPDSDPSTTFIYHQQLREVVRAAPLGIALNASTALILAAEWHRAIAALPLACWTVLMLACNLLRALGNVRIGRRLAAGVVQRRAILEMTGLVALTSLCWLVPVFFWSPFMSENDRVLLALVLMGIMAGGSASLGSTPSAALLLIIISSLGQVRMSLYHHSWIVVGLMVTMALALSNGAIASGRLFVRHVRARQELEEQGQLIGLLREFQSSGSDWLWELDGELCIRYMSRSMAESIGLPLERLIGRPLRSLVDPRGDYQPLSDGIRSLFHHLQLGTAFHEIAFPTIDGSRWYCLSGRPVIESDGSVSGWRGVGSDITALRFGPGTEGPRVARRDALTGLANRVMVREMIEEMRLRQMHGQGSCVLLVLDLDRFKMVNDTLGHAVGDRLLTEVARRLETACGSDAGVGRLGGDEFAIVWRGPSDTLTLLNLSKRIADAIDGVFTIGSSAIQIGVSIGIARAPVDGDTEDRLMRSADLALYRSKEQGRGCCSFFEPWMLAKAKAERLLESDVREAVRRGDLHLHYQPIVDARSFAVVGHEALLRWSHPRRGAIGPDVFVPIIEDVGLIHQIGDWVIREACAEAARWPRDRRVAVNVSVAQLTGAGLRQTVEEGLAASGLAPERLELEVTENVFLGDDIATLAALSSLQSLGVRLVLDDFGKGYSSFGYLSRACFAKIKIDQLFVRGAAAGRRESVAIVKSILALARGLGVETTAEGIETTAQAELMAHLGCTQLQGFLFGKPVAAAQIEHRSTDDDFPALPLKRRA